MIQRYRLSLPSWIPPSSPRIECVGKCSQDSLADDLFRFAIRRGDRRAVGLQIDGDARVEVRERAPPAEVRGVGGDVQEVSQSRI